MKKIGTFIAWCFFVSAFAQDMAPYAVFLKAGKVLIDLKTEKEVILSKGLYAKVLELNPRRRDVFYVYDKEGIAKYKTSAEDLVEIAEDISLLPNIDAEKTFPPKSVFKTENKIANFDTHLNLHFDDIGLASLNNIYSDEIKNVLATRYEIRTQYVPELPIQFGLSLNYQSAYWKNDFENVKISILSFGPTFQYNFYRDEDFKINALLGAEAAPIYEGSSANNKDEYSAMLFDIGAEAEWRSPMGLLSIGSHFRHHDLTLTKSNRPNLQLTPKEFSLSSLGFMVGYKIEWNL